MELAFLIFWVLMILWFFAGMMWNWPGATAPPYALMGNTLMLFVLIFLLGWKVWGFSMGH